MTRKSFPLVSVGIPTYNRPEKLKEILSSIISQTYQNLEIIVSDNCSSNAETERVVSDLMKIDPRIRYFYQKENLGLFYNFKFVFSTQQLPIRVSGLFYMGS